MHQYKTVRRCPQILSLLLLVSGCFEKPSDESTSCDGIYKIDSAERAAKVALRLSTEVFSDLIVLIPNGNHLDGYEVLSGQSGSAIFTGFNYSNSGGTCLDHREFLPCWRSDRTANAVVVFSEWERDDGSDSIRISGSLTVDGHFDTELFASRTYYDVDLSIYNVDTNITFELYPAKTNCEYDNVSMKDTISAINFSVRNTHESNSQTLITTGDMTSTSGYISFYK